MYRGIAPLLLSSAFPNGMRLPGPYDDTICAASQLCQSPDRGWQRKSPELENSGLSFRGLRLAGKGAAAAAAALDVRVVDGEAGAHEAVDVVELRSRDVGDAHRVYEDAHALGLEDLVVVVDLIVEVDAVLEAGAAAGPDADAKREILLAFLRHERLDFLRGIVGDADYGFLLLVHRPSRGMR